MQNKQVVLEGRDSVAGGTLTTDDIVSTGVTISFSIYNNTDLSLSFDLQAAMDDEDGDGNLEWVGIKDPSTFVQITYVVASGEREFRFATGCPTGLRFRLTCDSTGAAGDVRIVAVK